MPPKKRTLKSSTEFFDELASQLNKEDDRTKGWSPRRKMLFNIVKAPLFDVSLAILVLVNVVFVIIETNLAAADKPVPDWLQVANLFVMSCYVVEVAIRVYVTRVEFFMDLYSVFDLIIIVVDTSVTLIVSVLAVHFPFPIVMFRIARVLKITRAIRMMALFPELNLMLRGMVYAAKAIVWGIVMLGVVLAFWAILGVMFIHPLSLELAERGVWASIGCDRCPRAFESVQQAMLTFVQELVAGDSWGTVTLPIIEAYPETSIFFCAVLISVSLALMNLILAVIVERANEARSMSSREEAEKKEREFSEASLRLLELCKQLDADSSGTISFPELHDGFRANEEFASILRVMDVQESDLEVVFNMLDADGSGDVGYKEFVEQLHMMKHREAHTLLVFIKFYVMEIRSVLSSLSAGTKATRSLTGNSAMSMSTIGSQPRSSGHVRSKSQVAAVAAPAAATSAAATSAVLWPELQVELQRLEDIRKEMMAFSSTQVDRLDTVQKHLLAGLREMPEVADKDAGVEARDAAKGGSLAQGAPAAEKVSAPLDVTDRLVVGPYGESTSAPMLETGESADDLIGSI